MMVGRDAIVRNCYLENIGGTAIFLFKIKKAVTIYDTVINCSGSHANGISFYNDSLSLVASCIVYKTARPHTFENDTAHTVYNCVFDQKNLDNYVVANWGSDAVGAMKILNTIVVGSSGGFSITLDTNHTDYVIKNNFIQGMTGFTFLNNVTERNNNYYLDYSWSQSPSYNWELQLNEKNVSDSSWNVFFSDTSLTSGYSHVTTSIAIDSGTTYADLETILSNEMAVFEEYDFTKDIVGNSRISGSAVDIGPYEYQHGTSNRKLIWRVRR